MIMLLKLSDDTYKFVAEYPEMKCVLYFKLANPSDATIEKHIITVNATKK